MPSLPAVPAWLAWSIWAGAVLLDWATTRHAVRRYGVKVEQHPIWRRLLAKGGLWFEAGFLAASLALAFAAQTLVGPWGLIYVAAASLVIAGGGNLVRILRARQKRLRRQPGSPPN